MISPKPTRPIATYEKRISSSCESIRVKFND